MSYASENCLPQGTRVDDVREFVRLLGYQREGSLREEKVGRFEFYRYPFFAALWVYTEDRDLR